MLLGVGEISETRASGKSQCAGVPVHARGRRRLAAGERTSGDARLLSYKTGLSDVQRVRHVPVQEAWTGFAEQGCDPMEARHASCAIVAFGYRNPNRRSSSGPG